MDDSASVVSVVSTSAKFPPGEPNNEWTIEELVHWSLSQHHAMAIEKTEEYTESLRDYCERECDDIMALHSMAIEMAQNNENKMAPSAAASNTDVALKSPPKSNNNHIEVLITSGPHSGSKIHLRPKPGAPCFIGRSKGKKFIKNGISLHKDQEVSTTHGKILVEGWTMGLADGSNAANKMGHAPKFYFVDVGSTNGTTMNGDLVEPESKVLLMEGLELKVGGSMLKFILND
eukprot:CCRYP_006141-RA/>CCRYP_006141-RA protein AED:0.05 eAED:0.05 QI:212/1/1/1/1/1/2/122/231